MSDPVAFLTVRLDEDEAYLNSNRRHLWTQRPLREVAAKRAILAEHPHHAEDAAHPEWGFGCDTCNWDNEYGFGREVRWCATLRALAAIYSDHPDYDPEWSA